MGKVVADTVTGGAGSPVSGRFMLVHTPLSTARKSHRTRNSGESVLDRAVRRADELDRCVTGTPSISPKRTILSDFPYSHFLKMASESSLAFDPACGSPMTLISIIRANELAQAALAKARDVAQTSGPVATLVVAVGSASRDGATQPSDPVPSSSVPLGRTRRRKRASAMVPSRSSLRIKKLSFR